MSLSRPLALSRRRNWGRQLERLAQPDRLGGVLVTYSDLLKHPKWQQRRLRVLERAGFACERCSNAERELHAHHKHYIRGHKPWEYEDALLECLCETCHTEAHANLDELGMLVGLQPSAKLPLLTAAVASAIEDGPTQATLPAAVRKALAGLAAALSGADFTATISARNRLDDAIDEVVDLRRGPGGAWRDAA